MFLHMFPLWGNGSGSWLRKLSDQLAKKGHTVAIVAPEKRNLPGIKLYTVKPPQMGVFVGNPELKNAKKYEDMNGVEIGEIYTTYVNTTLKAVREFQPEIVHSFHTAFLPAVARLVKILYGIKFVITTHGSDLHYLSRDRRLIGLINDANAVARFITANSAFTKRWYLDMFGHEYAYKTKTILGGVDLADYIKDFSSDVAKINKKYGLEGKKIVLFTGRLTKYKGVDYLIRAAKNIQGTVLIVGDGPERQNLEKLIKDYEITNVKIIGWIKTEDHISLQAFYARADVYVAPSTWKEPFGLVIVEAMASKKAVVATHSGGITSIIKNEVNGLLVKTRDSKAISDKVNLLLADDELRKTMGNKAFETVKQKFTWEKMTDEYEKIYRKFRFTTKEYLHAVRELPKKHPTRYK